MLKIICDEYNSSSDYCSEEEQEISPSGGYLAEVDKRMDDSRRIEFDRGVINFQIAKLSSKKPFIDYIIDELARNVGFKNSLITLINGIEDIRLMEYIVCAFKMFLKMEVNLSYRGDLGYDSIKAEVSFKVDWDFYRFYNYLQKNEVSDEYENDLKEIYKYDWMLVVYNMDCFILLKKILTEKFKNGGFDLFDDNSLLKKIKQNSIKLQI